MDCIEASEFPLVFKADPAVNIKLKAPAVDQRISVRTATRALKGMQKEALVSYDDGPVWRTVSDEGPWLNGTDLAPFPLGFFTAGLVASYMSEFISHAKQQEMKINSLEVMVDSLYGMEGSLMKGTMTGSALPVNVTFKVNADASAIKLQELAFLSVATSPADAYLRSARDSIFTLNRNGEQLAVTGVKESEAEQAADPSDIFARVAPNGADSSSMLLIEKQEQVKHLGGEALGTVRATGDVGLSDSQKRQVHVRGVGTLRPDGMKGIQVACFVPIGSVFHFLSDDSKRCGGQERAPSGLAYLSAGLSYCFMTQLGRYAQVAKQKMHSYQIVQDTSFSLPHGVAGTIDQPASQPVDTHVFIGTEENAEDTQTLLRMGEQTCYLHAACRTALKTHIRVLPE